MRIIRKYASNKFFTRIESCRVLPMSRTMGETHLEQEEKCQPGKHTKSEVESIMEEGNN